MATEDLGRVLRVPGRLVKNPSSFSGSFPYGGTALGLVKDVVVKPQQRVHEVKAEEWGGETVEVLDLGVSYVMTFALRGLDDDAVASIFPNSATGTTSQRKLISHPGNTKAGALGSASSCALLFVPDDVARAPSVYFYRALILPDESAALTLALSEEGVVGVVARAIRRASDTKAVAIGLLEDMTV